MATTYSDGLTWNEISPCSGMSSFRSLVYLLGSKGSVRLIRQGIALWRNLCDISVATSKQQRVGTPLQLPPYMCLVQESSWKIQDEVCNVFNAGALKLGIQSLLWWPISESRHQIKINVIFPQILHLSCLLTLPSKKDWSCLPVWAHLVELLRSRKPPWVERNGCTGQDVRHPLQHIPISWASLYRQQRTYTKWNEVDTRTNATTTKRTFPLFLKNSFGRQDGG